MIRVGFILEGSGWMGGVNYYRNLFSALHLLPDRKIDPVMYVGTNVPENIIRNFSHASVVRTKLLDPTSFVGFLRRLTNRITGRRDPLLGLLMKSQGVRVLSHSGALCRHLNIKTLGWIPDFQHMHLPEFYSHTECKQRDILFKSLVSNCDAIVLSSYSALADLREFVSEAAFKAHVLHFVPDIDVSATLASISELEERYDFQGPYFYMPNQFWAHKNHKVVIAAMGKLRSRGICPTVICSGNTQDYRRPGHFEALLAEVGRLDLRQSFKVLGVIPYEDLLSLMQHSVSLINPSLFEGWSSTVEEAKALDKEIILSNLPVHLEQNPSKGRFFDPFNADELAALMQSSMQTWKESEQRDEKISHNRSYKANRLSFAETYQQMVLNLVEQ